MANVKVIGSLMECVEPMKAHRLRKAPLCPETSVSIQENLCPRPSAIHAWSHRSGRVDRGAASLRIGRAPGYRCYTRRYGRIPRTATRLPGSCQPASRQPATPGIARPGTVGSGPASSRGSAVSGLGLAASRLSVPVLAPAALRPSAIRPATAEASRLAMGRRRLRTLPRLRRARHRLHGLRHA